MKNPKSGAMPTEKPDDCRARRVHPPKLPWQWPLAHGPVGPDLNSNRSLGRGRSVVAEVHDRMPVILEPNNFEPWLSCNAGIELLKPAASNVLQRWPVSTRVNTSRAADDDASLIERLVEAE
jgi:hypothetical protein